MDGTRSLRLSARYNWNNEVQKSDRKLTDLEKFRTTGNSDCLILLGCKVECCIGHGEIAFSSCSIVFSESFVWPNIHKLP
jgi:hypothetical protein